MAREGRVSVMEADLDKLYYADEPEEQALPRKKVPAGDVYEAARAGDVERLKVLVEQGVNVNARDSWDSAALYYACLAGHLDAARMLMESGAICSEHTFDGDRCHYAALNLRVRKLLKAFEARPPPLQPLPKSLRDLFLSSKTNLQYFEGNSEACEQYSQLYGNNFSSDVTFYVNGQPIEAHRVILGARSPYFKKRFERDWKHRKEIRFANRKLTFSALFSLINFFYSDRLDVAVDDMEDLARICKVCRCFGLQKAVEKELLHQKFAEYKHLRDAEDSQKRFILQGSSLPEKERLPASLHRLLSLSLRRSKRELGFIEANPNGNGDHINFETEENREVSLLENLDFRNKESLCLLNGKLERPTIHRTLIRTLENKEEHINGNIALRNLEGTLRNITGTDSPSNIYHAEVSDDDHADVCFSVQGQYFRSHQVIMAARSEYFRMRFSRISGLLESSSDAFNTDNSSIPVLKEEDLSAETFEKLLEYMYTDQVTEVAIDGAEEMFDAASRYLLFPLKRVIADALLPQLEMATPADLCHWLQVADMYGVSKLREYCLDAIAANFETFAATRQFRRMLHVLPPPSGDSSARTSAPNAPGDEGRSNDGNLLDDLREKWLEAEGAELDKRDESAHLFDKRLELLVLAAENDEIENDEEF